MPLDPVLLADTKAWIEKAKIDLRGAEVDLAAQPPLVEDALFHCQQAIEKLFKAFLTFHDRPFRKTHNLEELGSACLELDPTLKNLVEESVPFTEFAWAFRYPGELVPPSLEEAESALTTARKAFQLIDRRLPAEIHS